MIRLRAEQMEALSCEQKRKYNAALGTHLRWIAPGQTAVMRQEELDDVIEAAWEKAENYGFTLGGPIRLIAELMFLFGSGFDTDPQYTWARTILTEMKSSEMGRAVLLQEQTVTYLDQVAGVDRENAWQALDRFLSLPMEQFDSWGRLEENFVDTIWSVYLEKAAFVGRVALRMLFQEAIAEAKRLSMMTPRAVAQFAILMFIAGHHVLKDPLYKWAMIDVPSQQMLSVQERTYRVHDRAVAVVRTLRARNIRLKSQNGQF